MGPKKNNELVKLYKWNDAMTEKTLYTSTYTYKLGDQDGYYAFDIVTGWYDILVREGTEDEGGWIQTYLQSGQWPNLRRDIEFGNIIINK